MKPFLRLCCSWEFVEEVVDVLPGSGKQWLVLVPTVLECKDQVVVAVGHGAVAVVDVAVVHAHWECVSRIGMWLQC